MSEALSVQLWSEQEFGAARAVWQGLLEASQADPLFMSWDWQWTWWQTHSTTLAATLQLVAVHRGPALVGLAPFYSHRARTARWLSTRRLQCIGTAWRDSTAAFSEYFDLIVAAQDALPVGDAIRRWLRDDAEWDDWVVSCVKPDSRIAALFDDLQDRDALARPVETLSSYSLALTDDFESLTARLSAGTRRRLLNQRARLTQPSFEVAKPDELLTQVERMQSWRAQRWGEKQAASLCAFELKLAQRLYAAGRLQLTVLSAASNPISILYDIRIGDTEYYLTSAFAPGITGHSPGFLHLGYALEAACASGVRRFDLLAGQGRTRNYKQDLATDSLELVSRQLVRSPLLRTLYKLKGH